MSNPSNDGLELIIHCVSLLCWCFCNSICTALGAHEHRDMEQGLGINDRQSNNSSQANELRRDNRCNDIFFIEPNSLEAARIRAQLEKDDKELPSYDEVMRIANLPTATASPAANNLINSLPCVVSNAASSLSVNTTNTTLTAPAYTEAGPNLRALTPPPYTPEPIGATMVLPIATPLHAQRNAQSS